MNILPNEIKLTQVYEFNPNPTNSIEYANNLAYHLGASTHKNNYFDKHLNTLVQQGILTKLYDVTDPEGYREAIYNFAAEEAQISFEGFGLMGLKLYYNYK